MIGKGKIGVGTFRKFGWIPDKIDERDYSYGAVKTIIKTLPNAMDLRAFCPTIYDQQDIGSCVANTVAAAIEFGHIRQKLEIYTPSRLFIYYNARALDGNTLVDAGASLRNGIKTVNNLGNCPEIEWPYITKYFAVQPPQPCYTHALKHKVLSYFRINTLDQMKACLAVGYPFTFGVMVYSNFPMETKTGIIPVPKLEGDFLGGHAMLAVGYDNTKKIFIVRNSWGENWGEHGYGTIPYSYLSNPLLGGDFWTIRVVQ